MRRSICLAACLAILASCERSPEPSEAPATAAFSYTATADLSGYYLPLSEARIGPWSLDHVFVGQPAEFDAWRSGQRGSTFAPVMLQFDDVTSPMVRTEIGEGHSVVERVLPTAYSVSDGRIRFEGRSARLGTVTFDGRLDAGALATARRNLGDEGAVVTGALTVDDLPPRTVRLRWWMGD
ncbi:MAG: hypothetical protein Q8R45_10445 [Brevundimonas sp.]|uniref:hypothetical protein n=1 Tax=Brevundimonas sp. TaxID=1871086 RepID=UPI0027170C8E|nr:hypothetical protein [Brevundimonas sp.]MDO9587925.1 hypothetical protein [Brevundimonas sp.]MDP3657368.1 hypothetical protein [Brevundimonas sp.]MDZ4111925.1 hypothetical protein [Brevundimonas sp.]